MRILKPTLLSASALRFASAEQKINPYAPPAYVPPEASGMSEVSHEPLSLRERYLNGFALSSLTGLLGAAISAGATWLETAQPEVHHVIHQGLWGGLTAGGFAFLTVNAAALAELFIEYRKALSKMETDTQTLKE